MSADEHRELDDWIAEHVFGSTLLSGDYSTDPTAAMQVLEKCAQRETITIEASLDGKQFWIARLDTESRNEDFCKCAETLPLAICQFSKHLFPK